MSVVESPRFVCSFSRVDGVETQPGRGLSLVYSGIYGSHRPMGSQTVKPQLLRLSSVNRLITSARAASFMPPRNHLRMRPARSSTITRGS